MKQMIVMMLASISCFGHGVSVMAQYAPKPIAPYPIDISYDKTSNIIFPFAIKSVDRGSKAVLAQKAPGIENILQIKAAEQNFRGTNLTVITADGKFYSFEVSYNNAPATLNISFAGDDSGKAMIKDQPVSEATLLSTANIINSKRRSLHKKFWQEEAELSLLNIFIADDLLWMELRITNESSIPYQAAHVRFFLRDKKEGKRTATQEVEITSLYQQGMEKVEKGQSRICVFGFQPFTVPAAKELIIQVSEASVGRTLTLHLNHRIMLKAKSL